MRFSVDKQISSWNLIFDAIADNGKQQITHDVVDQLFMKKEKRLAELHYEGPVCMIPKKPRINKAYRRRSSARHADIKIRQFLKSADPILREEGKCQQI